MTGEIWKGSRKLLAYALALVMAVGVVQAVPVWAVEGTEAATEAALDTTGDGDGTQASSPSFTVTVSPNDDYSFSIKETGAVPTDITRKYIVKYGSDEWPPQTIDANDVGDTKKISLNKYIDQNGKYTIGVWATGSDGKDIPGYGGEAEINYTAQGKALYMQEVKWSATTPGTVEFSLSGNDTTDLQEYEVKLEGDGDPKRIYIEKNNNQFPTSYDLSGYTTWLDGKYQVSVRAISKDLSKTGNSAWKTASDLYEPGKTVEKVWNGVVAALWNTVSNNSIAEPNENTTMLEFLNAVSANNAVKTQAAAAAVTELKKHMAGNGLKMAMWDPEMVKVVDFVEQMSTGSAATITVSTTDEEAQQIFEVNTEDVKKKIKVVGAKLNASNPSQAAEFKLSKSAKTISQLKLDAWSDVIKEGAVLLDIALDKAASPWVVPVNVTMPVPKGINKNNVIILHMDSSNMVEEYLKPDLNTDGTITFTVTKFSTFVFAEDLYQPGSSSGGGGNSGSGNSGTGRPDAAVEALITVAEAGATIKTKDITTLANSTMKALLKRSDVTLVMEYTYKGVNYVVTIPAGKAVNNSIPWYGPLYLAGMYGNGAGTDKTDKPADTVYVVRRGDTMSKIAKMSGMSLAELAKKNPQIKNLNRIRGGQSINR